MATREWQLLYSRGLARSSPVNETGRAWAYFALFSEIGIVLLITILAGLGAGYWVDTRLNSLPIFALIGFALGLVVGARGVWVLISRFLASFDD
jgi:hypothetical protein